MKKIAIGFGTRPELIKLSHLIKFIKSSNEFDTFVFSTGQHKNLIDQSKDIFNLKINQEFQLPINGENLSDLVEEIKNITKKYLSEIRPDIVIVQGDTASTYGIGMAASELGIKIAHIEAGLRSYNLQSPYPEEGYRTALTKISTYHFAPTENNIKNLQNDGVLDNIFQVGNTGIDSLKSILAKFSLNKNLNSTKKILLTIHRRENLNSNLELYLDSLIEFIKIHPDYEIIYPIHPNPKIKSIVETKLSPYQQIKMIEPLSYLDFLKLMLECDLVISDSGGLQEETSLLNIPMILLREFADRNEKESHPYFSQIKNPNELNKSIEEFINLNLKKAPVQTSCAYGDGTSSEQIFQILKSRFL